MMKTSVRERAPLMNASTLLSALQWAEYTFGSVHLGDQRRTERAVEIALAIAPNPAASLPAQMQDEAATEAAYRFLQTPDVTYEKLIGPHVAQTRAHASKQPQVLLIQDTTEVDYQQHPTTTGLGPIGNGSHHGYLLQSVLAGVAARREVLGLMHQEPFLRQPAPQGETRREREQRERESQVWERSVQAIGAPPAGVQWIHVGDRYSDIFALLSLMRQQQCDFVVRAAQDRCVDLLVEQADAPVPPRSHHSRRAGQEAEPKPQHLFEVVRGWSAGGEQERCRDATKQSKARAGAVVISFGCLRLALVEGGAVVARVRGPAAELTAQQCWYTIARHGGYLRRRSSGPPGWKTLWKGWFYLQALLEGVHVAPRLSLD